MSGLAYYNEVDGYAAQWICNLAEAGHIARGHIDTRSVVDVRPADLVGCTQFHTFAGIAGWSLALRLAGVPDDFPVWTGSCPCQPFSAAGRRGGFSDDRHLWPAWFELIRACRPALVFGEQVASADGLGWLDAVFADLEGEGYACRAADLCAAGTGAPHIRQRLWFVAHRLGERWERRQRLSAGRHPDGPHAGRQQGADGPVCFHEAGAVVMGDAERIRLRGEGCGSDAGAPGGMPDQNGQRQWLRSDARAASGPLPYRWTGAHHGGWDDADWLRCSDDRWRPVEPGSFPLAHGVSARVGKLRAYGNAIVPQVAAAFIGAVIDTLTPTPTPGGLAEGER